MPSGYLALISLLMVCLFFPCLSYPLLLVPLSPIVSCEKRVDLSTAKGFNNLKPRPLLGRLR